MSKKKTELERREDRLKLLSKKDHKKAIDLQNKFGLTLGEFVEVLLAGAIVTEEHNTSKREVVDEPVRFNPLTSSWDFITPRPEIGTGRVIRHLGDTYTMTVEDMENLQAKREAENQKALASLNDFVAKNCHGALATELEDLISKHLK